jgi:transcriptional regulator with XRE-family HTH domain
MSEQQGQGTPFKTLGDHLRFLREQSKESLAEVSGAVEIDEQVLERIEAGAERPVEDILMLLINHFNMQDQEAVQLWELAGYTGEVPERWRTIVEDLPSAAKNMVMLLAMDTRTMYSDSVHIDCNQAGVTMSFAQTAGDAKSTPVAKVGMSYEQAESVLQTLQQALLHAKYLRGPKQLPPQNDKTTN